MEEQNVVQACIRWSKIIYYILRPDNWQYDSRGMINHSIHGDAKQAQNVALNKLEVKKPLIN